tara:strand:- start:313 stop:966 length:654 start_codon:yes stop_codon:yes gene_type:complete
MKSFKQYITEDDIELISLQRRSIPRELRIYQNAFNYGRKKNLGEITPGYSIHKAGGDFFIRHDESKKVVGHISNATPHQSKNLGEQKIIIHPEHTAKVIGHSLPVAAYKHLWGHHGYEITSDYAHSLGGLKVWHNIIADPDTSEHVHAIHHQYGGKKTDLGLARKLPTSDIWSSGSAGMRRKARRKGVQVDKLAMIGNTAINKASNVHLVLKRKKNK